MLHFKKIKLSEDRTILDIDVYIEELDYNSNVYLDSIKIQDVESYGTTSVNYQKSLTGKLKEIKLSIPVSEILSNIKNNMLIITVNLTGTVDINCPCGKDIMNYMAIFADIQNITSVLNSYLNEFKNNCSTPKGFSNYFLLFKAFEYAARTCRYIDAIKYWKMLNKETKIITSNNCSCHG